MLTTIWIAAEDEDNNGDDEKDEGEEETGNTAGAKDRGDEEETQTEGTLEDSEEEEGGGKIGVGRRVAEGGESKGEIKPLPH